MQKAILLICLFGTSILAQAGKPLNSPLADKARTQLTNSGVSFIENKGQLIDDKNRPVPFVLFKVGQRGLDIYVTEKGITYVFLKPEEDDEPGMDKTKRREAETQIEYCRADVEFEGAHIMRSQIEYGGEAAGVSNFYLAHCPKGIMNVKSYKGFTIRNIYPGIDWQWQVVNNRIEQDFIVQPGADAGLIKMKYQWADINLTDEGHELLLQTPMGTLKEGKSISYSDGKEIDTRYMFNKNKKEASFNVAAYDHSKPLRIDPPMQLIWGTYVNGDGPDGLWAVCSDPAGNIYSAGECESTVYPTINPGGSAYFQTTAGGGWDANICKFGPNNNLVWCTFYGGSGSEEVYGAMDVDSAGNLYFTNCSSSSNLPLVNPGGGAYFNNTLNGAQDVLIGRFAPNGALVWSTLYGGASTNQFMDGEIGLDLRVKFGRIYMCGMTDETGGFPLLNPGSGAYYQSTHAAAKTGFVSVFDTAGVQLWSTFLGGSTQDECWAINIDNGGNVMIGGRTGSSDFPTLNPLNGSYFQAANAGGFDGFLAKFDPQFNMIYSTYWGGSNDDMICNVNYSGPDTYISGCTGSINLPMTNPGGSAFYSASGGLFINRFDNTFNSSWGTYYQGGQFWSIANIYNARSMAIDGNGNVIIVGYNFTDLFPAPCAYYSAGLGGGLVAFNNLNQRIWATTFGSAAGCWGNAVCFNPGGDIYVAGEMQGTPISVIDPGGGAYFDSVPGGADDGFVLRFSSINSTGSGLSVAVSGILSCDSCSNMASVLASNGAPPYTFLWSNGSSADTAISLCPGTYFVTVTDACSGSVIDSVIVAPSGGSPVNIGNDTAICSGANLVLNAGSGWGSYQWNDNSIGQTYSVSQSGTYSVTVTSLSGCTAADAIAVTINSGDSLSAASATTTCGASNGMASVNVVSGSGPFSYLWNNGDTTSSITNLGANTYSVTVTDAGGCSGTASVTVASSGISPVTITQDQTIICPNDSALICAPTGYVAYLWNNAQSTQCIYTSLAGNYYCTVTDANNCTTTSNHLGLAVYQQLPIGMVESGDTLTCSTQAQSYQWYLNGNPIPGDTSNFCITNQVGNYTVAIADSNGCTETSSPIRVTGINELFNNALKVYPNPSLGSWFLEADQSIIGSEIEIYDAAGRLVFYDKLTKTKSEINLQTASGVYLLRIISIDNIATIKLIKF